MDSGMRYFNLELSLKFGWCRARDLLRTTNSSANVYLIKVNNISTRKRCEICSKLTTRKATGFKSLPQNC